MSATEQRLIEKIKHLSLQHLAEVEDFVNFLRALEDDQRITQASAKIAEASFAAVWNNEEDAAYDVRLNQRNDQSAQKAVQDGEPKQ